MLEFSGLFRTVQGWIFGTIFGQFGTGVLQTVLDNPGLNYRIVFEQSGIEIFGTVLGSPGTDLWAVIGPCVLFCMWLLKKKKE